MMNPENNSNLHESLPFTYRRVYDPEKAAYSEWRINPVRLAGKVNEPKSDDEILDFIIRDRVQRDWFTSEYWRSKGKPVEQVVILVGNQEITLFNWNAETPIKDERLNNTVQALKQLSQHFPQALEKIRWMLVDNVNVPSAFGDSVRYPYNGHSYREWQAFRFLPRGVELIPHRIAKTSNLEGTLVHEASHPIEDDFRKEWSESYQWEYCIDHKDEWEIRPTPEGEEKKWFNKKTGEMAPQHMFPLQPEECVTEYARLSIEEDICESIVAYIYDPDLLKAISPKKYEILEKHDQKAKNIVIKANIVPETEIQLPEIKPEVVTYFIKEPQ